MTKRSGPGDQIAHFGREAAHYDQAFWSLGNRDNRNHRVKISRLNETLALRDGERVLEIGTGTGVHGRWLLDRVQIDYTGIDVTVEMLEQARKRLPGAALLTADAKLLPFSEASFDAVFCSGTLHHMEDPWRVLGEMARVARSGGRVAVMEPNWKYPTTLVAVATQRVEWNCFKIGPRTLMPRMRAAGLTHLKLERVLYTPPRPGRLIPLFETLDRQIARTPGLRRMSLMLLASGTKP